ncbi:hypothetical protein ACA910_011190 [Epithemia clementina (nom. ined.)]
MGGTSLSAPMLAAAAATTTTTTTTTTQCVAQDHLGRDVSLLEGPLLPVGVSYNATTNSLVCGAVNACREWTIRNCRTVHCMKAHACQNARIHDADTVECFDYAACQDTHVNRAHEVRCGYDAVNACMHMNVNIATTPSSTSGSDSGSSSTGSSTGSSTSGGLLVCVGNNACASDADTQMTITVGAKGEIQCMDGKYAYSCQHMLVLVHHARRACFRSFGGGGGDSSDHQPDCAVICDGKWECNQKTIQFRVQENEDDEEPSE